MTHFDLLNIHPMTLHSIDWKMFDFPKIHALRYTDHNSQNELVEMLQITASYGTKTIYLFTGYPYPETWTKAVQQCLDFNKNPESHWRELLIPLLEKELKLSKERRKAAKAKEKTTKKALRLLSPPHLVEDAS